MMKRKLMLKAGIITILLVCCTGPMLFSQIQTVGLPDPGFKERIKNAVDEIRIVDTHEHLQSEESILGKKESEPIDFTHLFPPGPAPQIACLLLMEKPSILQQIIN